MLESRGKGSVQVNGKTVRKNTNCILHSGDELVFGATGNHAYVSLKLTSIFPTSLYYHVKNHIQNKIKFLHLLLIFQIFFMVFVKFFFRFRPRNFSKYP